MLLDIQAEPEDVGPLPELCCWRTNPLSPTPRGYIRNTYTWGLSCIVPVTSLRLCSVCRWLHLPENPGSYLAGCVKICRPADPCVPPCMTPYSVRTTKWPAPVYDALLREDNQVTRTRFKLTSTPAKGKRSTPVYFLLKTVAIYWIYSWGIHLKLTLFLEVCLGYHHNLSLGGVPSVDYMHVYH